MADRRPGVDGRADATFTSAGARSAATTPACAPTAASSGAAPPARLRAVYFGEGDQTLDFRTFQDHAAPDTTSNLLFKGAVGGHSRSVYTGLIRVRKDARGTNAFQTNRNIKLSDDAWAESVPNLEIENNDVHCSHASTVGPIDEEQRFYLESRGVPTAGRRAADRRRLLRRGAVDGFPVAGCRRGAAQPRRRQARPAGPGRGARPMSDHVVCALDDLAAGHGPARRRRRPPHRRRAHRRRRLRHRRPLHATPTSRCPRAR